MRAQRRDSEGRLQAAPSWESLVERQIREAIADANRAIERVNTEAPTTRQHRRPLDPTAEAERLERAFGKDEAGSGRSVSPIRDGSVGQGSVRSD